MQQQHARRSVAVLFLALELVAAEYGLARGNRKLARLPLGIAALDAPVGRGDGDRVDAGTAARRRTDRVGIRALAEVFTTAEADEQNARGRDPGEAAQRDQRPALAGHVAARDCVLDRAVSRLVDSLRARRQLAACKHADGDSIRFRRLGARGRYAKFHCSFPSLSLAMAMHRRPAEHLAVPHRCSLRRVASRAVYSGIACCPPAAHCGLRH